MSSMRTISLYFMHPINCLRNIKISSTSYLIIKYVILRKMLIKFNAL